MINNHNRKRKSLKPHPKRKYLAKKSIVNGIKFDSRLEADYYRYLLKSGLKEGIDFKRQVRFVLFDANKTIQAKKPIKRSYIADFVFYENGKAVRIEDTKGYKVLPLASFKMDLASDMYRLPIYIVRRQRGKFVKELR